MSGFTELLGGKPLFKYLDVKQLAPVGGRGSATRTLMLAHGIEYDEELVGLDVWGASEKQAVKETVNPAGVLPVVKIGDKWLSEHMAISRYISRKVGLYGKDADLDYDSDQVTDQYQSWRDAWAATIGKDKSSPETEKYVKERENHFVLFERLYAGRSSQDSPYLIPGDKPGFADCAVAMMIRDDAVLFGPFDLEPYPQLSAMYSALTSIPAVAEWIKHQES